jgi:hypothetical protein
MLEQEAYARERSIAAVAQAANNGSDLGLSSTSLSFLKKWVLGSALVDVLSPFLVLHWR